MSFGTPNGSSRMPALTIDVPPPPPMPTIASTSGSVRAKAAKAAPMPATAVPRSSPPRTAAVPSGWCAATSAAETSVATVGARVPRSTVRGFPPASATRTARKASSAPFVSAVPTT